MKKLLLAFIICNSSFAVGFAQETNLDSLYTVWQDNSQQDSTRVKAYEDYIYNGFIYSLPDSAYVLAQNMIVFSKVHSYLKAEAIGIDLQGITWKVRGEYLKAMESYSQGLKIMEQIGDAKGIASSLNNVGTIYDIIGNIPKGLEYYTRSLKIQEQINDPIGTANTLHNVGGIYQRLGDYMNALAYHNKSLKIREQIGNLRGILVSLNSIGSIYASQGDYAKAFEFYTKSLKINEQVGDENRKATSLSGIGNIHKIQGNYPMALEYFNRSLKVMEQVGDKSGMAHTFYTIGDIYKIQGDYFSALEFCQKSFDLAISIGVIENQIGGCKCLYDIHKFRTDDSKALMFHELLSALEDSLDTKATIKMLQQMEFQKAMLADSLKQEEEKLKIEMNHKLELSEKEKSRNMFVAGGLILLLIAISLFGRNHYIRKSKRKLEKENERSENLLLNILPAEIAQELKEKGRAEARDFELVSILFTDFKGFTQASAKMSAQDLVSEINFCFEAFDGIMEKYGIEKIKTIGDAYMAAGGLPVPTDDSVKNTVLAALEMQSFVLSRKAAKNAKGEMAFEMRVGIHTGPVVAGIVGVKKFQYDIWGDTVNTASRMESSGEVGKVNISQATYELLREDSQFTFESRGKIEAKGKGEMEMYFVSVKESQDEA